MNNFVKTMIYQMARQTGTSITPEHFRVLEFAYDYYRKNKIGPMYHILKTNLGITRDRLKELFPHELQSVYTWVGIPIQSSANICKPAATLKVDDYRQVYFDHNATTYLRDEIKRILIDYFKGKYGFGNPSSSTDLGRAAYEHIYNARVEIARTLKVSPFEIYFTSGGSEGNNTAIKGIAMKHLKAKGHIISTKTEHPSVLSTLSWLKKTGFSITLVDVDKKGFVRPEYVENAICENTILVSVMGVNNEIGTINPIEEISRICRAKNIPFVVDGVQMYGKIPVNPKKLGISAFVLSGHKIYAPKGIGAIYVDKNLALEPLIHGGEQEAGFRAGTENVGYIMALGKAAGLIHLEMEEENKRLCGLRDFFLENLEKNVPGYIINGTIENRLPNNLNIGFPDVDSGALLLSLNQIGIYVSSGSACSSGSKEASHVIKALGVDTDRYGIIRFSFGKKNTTDDIKYLFKYLPEILSQLKKIKK